MTVSINALAGITAILYLCGLRSGLAARLQRGSDIAAQIWIEDEGSTEVLDAETLRATVTDMFDFGFSNYMGMAYPRDHLLPISCKGGSFEGDLAITLVDTLDTLMLMDRLSDIEAAIEVLPEILDFDKGAYVNVFEINIRVLGGLISTHLLLTKTPELIPEYNGFFLDKAVVLGDKLLAAFNTSSGLPSKHMNLGYPNATGGITSTAAAGTFLLEFAALSKATGNMVYWDKAAAAMRTIYSARSELGLVGSWLDTEDAKWTNPEVSIGRESDSYYEYLLKGYLMLGDEELLDMFADLYGAMVKYMKRTTADGGNPFFLNVNMFTGTVTTSTICSLGAFWPGLQVLMGMEEDARELHSLYAEAWRIYGFIPEQFDQSLQNAANLGYILRPEHIESTYLLYTLTGDESFLKMAATILRLLQLTKTECGYAQLRNSEELIQEDVMESFFLSETVKYLYTTFSEAPALPDFYLFTTEAHLLPPFTHPDDVNLGTGEDGAVPRQCEKVCRAWTDEEEADQVHRMQRAYPLLAADVNEARLLRQRRCRACQVVLQRLPPTT